MSDAEYAALGLKSGLEVHQQLLTDKKLFCHCPAGRYSHDYDSEILRHMRPTLSELGEYDGTALMEFKTQKDIHYRLSRETVCTYEMDDAPPFEINEQAVDIAIEVSLLLRLQMIDELHIARKQYLDGSIPTGFQRTALLGVHGWIDYPGPLGGPVVHADRRIGIRQLSLEEDSCREVSDVGHLRTYIADRLGMPLIEVVTEPDMRTPREVAEVGQLIRYLTRATGKVRRGIGAARQDVNVSIAGGTRIEIKGVPRIPLFQRLVHYEAYRQKALLEVRQELRQRGANPQSWQHQARDVTRLVYNTRFGPIVEALEAGHQVWAVRLPLFAGVLNKPTQPHTLMLQEFADRVRVIACLQGEPNLICSDVPVNTLSPGEWRKVLRSVRSDPSDTVIVVWGGSKDAQTAVEEIRIRAVDAMRGVPQETRQAYTDGGTGFERILPGPDRMYPDTDLPPKPIASQRVDAIRTRLVERPVDRAARYAKFGLSTELCSALIRSGASTAFDAVMKRVPQARPCLVAHTLACHLKHLRREGLDTDRLSHDFLVDLFEIATRHDWPKESVHDALAAAVSTAGPLTRDQLASVVPAALDEDDLAQIVHDSLQDAVPVPPRRTARRAARSRRARMSAQRLASMGRVMGALRGRVHGRDVAAVIGEAPLGWPGETAAP